MTFAQPVDSLYARRSAIVPPEGATQYRGWSVWYDAGDFEHGICYRETKWRGCSPTGELIEHPNRASTGDLVWVKAEIDKRIDNGRAG